MLKQVLKTFLFSIFLLKSHVMLSNEERIRTPEQALVELMNGNKRYMQDKLLHPNRNQARRESLVAKQTPFAAILGCSDSRVSPEIIFDQGIGDLFIIRVAGNIVGPLELDSIDFAVHYLKSSLVFVLGHESCGAVHAVLEGDTKNIKAVAAHIEPAVAKSKTQTGNALENAIKNNVIMTVKKLKNSEIIAKYIAEKKIKVVGGYYHLASGEIELLNND